ncbi:unnamed protein product [Schistosoma mattheei]|uniref:Uncharacterized protein n=1 Tax=Schistosoma mattheei TaxID=31246 RepID=A0A183P932_9TREM|nr:unnamed protein product [Schistosoma mattheei]
MVVGGSRQETLDPGFVLLGNRQQGVPVILRELVLPGGFNPVSPSFTVRSVTRNQVVMFQLRLLIKIIMSTFEIVQSLHPIHSRTDTRGT